MKSFFETIKLGDVTATFASLLTYCITQLDLSRKLKEDGLQHFADWYCEYYQVK